MDKRGVIQEIHAMIDVRLFESPVWLVDRETSAALDRKLIQLGLNERVSQHATRATRLGRELDVDLVMVFVGLWDEFEVPCLWHIQPN